MVQNRIIFFLRVYRCLDIVLVLSALLAADWLMYRYVPAAYLRPAVTGSFPVVAVLAGGLWGFLLKFNMAYSSQRGKKFERLLSIVLRTSLQGFLGLTGLVFFLGLDDVQRPLLVTFVLLSTVLLIIEKIAVVKTLGYIRKQGKNFKRVLIVGTEASARDVVARIESNPELGLRIKGCLAEDPQLLGRTVHGMEVLGTYDQLAEVLHVRVVDEVFLCLPLDRLAEIQRALAICEDMGINGRVVAQLYEPTRARIFHDEIMDIPLFSVSTQPPASFFFMLKTGGDVVVAALLLVLLSPLFLLIALAVKLTSSGPVFYKQWRTGYNGRKIGVYKFRTMVKDAEHLRSTLAARNEMAGPIFKIRNDPRVTPLGKALRRLSFDELPQLINVFKGEMSLVGPRPLPLVESEQITGAHRRRLSMKPGITGLWQVSGRSEANFDKLIQFDLQYVDHWSLQLDFAILLKTLWVVMVGRGAY